MRHRTIVSWRIESTCYRLRPFQPANVLAFMVRDAPRAALLTMRVWQFHRERPHPEEPADGGRLEGWATRKSLLTFKAMPHSLRALLQGVRDDKVRTTSRRGNEHDRGAG